MRWTISRRRRLGIVAAVFLPLGIVLQGLSQVDAQFPKGGGIPQPPIPPAFNPPGQNPPGFNPGQFPPGFNQNPPGFNPPGQNPPGFNPGQNPPGFNPPGQNPPGPGFNPPKGPNQPFGGNRTYEWRCSKCKAVIATTTSPFNPGVSDCPRCGTHFINGGGSKGGLLAPPNLPMNNVPPIGAAPPIGPPAGVQAPNGPAAGFQPPNAPPAEAAPPMVPPAVLPPLGIPENAIAPIAANDCKWCSGPAGEGSTYCTGCKIKMGGVLLAVTILVLGVLIIPIALLVWFLVRSGGR